MDEQTRKQQIQNTFNTACEGYDRDPLRFFRLAAEGLPEMHRLRGDEHVLDVAAGTGTPAMAIAPHLPRGRLTGVDFSEGMLAQARAKTAEQNHTHVDFQLMDMTAMSLPEDYFDAANCSFGIFFVEDMDGLTRHIAGKLKPGGHLVTCHFLEGSFAPLADLFIQRMNSYGVEMPPPGWMRLGNEALNRALLEAAGLENIETMEREISYHYDSPEQWWELVWYAGFRGFLMQLNEEQLAEFKRDHLAEISAQATAEGIPLQMRIIYTRGHKPESNGRRLT
jgi:ubiquinone/menaquinone biosynthesis C-methylase UbiE